MAVLVNRKSWAVLIAAAAICVTGAFRIEVTTSDIPVVLQNLFVILAAALLGPLQGAAATGIFLALGIAGVPVFAGFHGGYQYFMGATGGYLAGYFVGAIVTGIFAGEPEKNYKNTIVSLIISTLLGFLSIYACGAIRYFRFNDMDASIQSFVELWEKCVKPFLFGDALKLAAIVPLAYVFRPKLAKSIFSEKK